MANVLALVDDLFFQAKMQETARQEIGRASCRERVYVLV